jgi:hypothetical protein
VVQFVMPLFARREADWGYSVCGDVKSCINPRKTNSSAGSAAARRYIPRRRSSLAWHVQGNPQTRICGTDVRGLRDLAAALDLPETPVQSSRIVRDRLRVPLQAESEIDQTKRFGW